MGFGVCQNFDVSIASGASTSTQVNLGRAFAKVVLDPTGAGGAVSFQAAPPVQNAAGTYRFLSYEVTSGVSGPQTVTVASSMSGTLVHVPQLTGHQFVKVVVTGTVANGATLKLICSDY